jgi:hypothetical protein
MRIISKSHKIKFAHNSIAWYRWSDGNNLSLFNDKEAVRKAIYSWMLIDVNFKVRFNKLEISYVEWMKAKLFINVKNSYPELIKENNIFFVKQIQNEKKESTLFYKILKKIRMK